MTRLAWAGLCGVLLVGAGGCLERRIVVTSDPAGAIVWLNEQEVGRTPVETGFQFYGDYDVRLRKEGFEPISTNRRATSPWYEYPGPDLVAAALPVPFRKTVHWHFVLSPSPEPTEAERDALVRRAEEFRASTPSPPAPRP